MKLKFIQKLKGTALPRYASTGAAAFDFSAIGLPEEGVVISAESPQIIRTGLACEIPEGWVMFVNSRSGHGFKYDVRLSNCQGWIDSDFRGELMLKLATDGAPFEVKNGDRIAQALLVQCPQFEFEMAEELSVTERGEGGFGSTGKN